MWNKIRVMIIKLEKTKDPSFVLVVDELDNYKGKIHLGVLHKHCLLSEESFEMDEYTYYHADKEKINKYCKK